MATSTIPAFKAALLTRLQADVDLTGVQVTWGYPNSAKPAGEWVMLAGAAGTQVTAAMGQKHREETWVQTVIVSCTSALKNSPQTLTERAFTIVGVIEDSLRTWSTTTPYFGGTVRHALVTGLELEEFVSTEEREARVTVSISCAQRI